MGPAADRDLVPEYPGITDSDRVADWDPPFPIDLNRVRPTDEEYWNRYRATPKAFIPIERGQQLWGSRHGALTALRLMPPQGTPLSEARERYEKALLGELDPLAMGFSVYDVRAQSLAASNGATDFGEYFTYFSTFLVVSALLLAGLFFKLGVEQRLQEVGLLQALGLDPAAIRRLLVGEALFLAGIGGVVGIAGAIAYSGLIMLGLRTWWVDAVGTTALTLHVDPVSLLAGALAVVAIAVVSIWWSLRALATASTRSLLSVKGGQARFSGERQGKLRPTPCRGHRRRRTDCRTPPRDGDSASCRASPDFSEPARSASSRCCASRRCGCAAAAGARFMDRECGRCGGSDGATRLTGRREAFCVSRSSRSRRSSSSR